MPTKNEEEEKELDLEAKIEGMSSDQASFREDLSPGLGLGFGLGTGLGVLAGANVPARAFKKGFSLGNAFLGKLPYMGAMGLLGSLADYKLLQNISDKARSKRDLNISKKKKNIGEGNSLYPIAKGLQYGSAAYLQTKASEKILKDLQKELPSKISRLTKTLMPGKGLKVYLPLGLGALGALAAKMSVDKDPVKEYKELNKTSAVEKKDLTKRDYRIGEKAYTLTLPAAYLGGVLGNEAVKKLYQSSKMNAPIGQRTRASLLGSALGALATEPLVDSILKKRITGDRSLKGAYHIPILTGLLGGGSGYALTSQLAPQASKKLKGVNAVLGAILGGLTAKNLITEKTASDDKGSLNLPVGGISALSGGLLGRLLAKNQKGILAKTPSVLLGAALGKEIGDDLAFKLRSKKDGKNSKTKREYQIRESASGVLPLLGGAASLLGANEVGKILENVVGSKKSKSALIPLTQELKQTPSIKRLGAAGVAGILGLAAGGMLAKEVAKHRDSNSKSPKVPLLSALSSGLISGILSKGALSKWGPAAKFPRKRIIGINAALGSILGGIYGEDLLSEKTASLGVNMRKLGLDKVAASDSTGVSQLKQRKTVTRKKYTAEGTGLGAAGGGLAGYKITKALGPKWNIPATLAGMALGGLAGRHVGKKGSKTKTKYIEGVVKKQEKRKDSPVKLPSLNRKNVRGLLAYNR